MRKATVGLCAGVSVLCIVNPAFAQTGQVIDETPPPGTELPTSEPEGADAADDTGELAPSNEIVVSARRRAESVQDVPQTVNVVTSAQVEKLNLRNFTEIASVVPGLQLQSSGAFTNTATVRGVSFDPGVSGNNPTVEFYLNDAPIASGFLFQSTYDFGQFELQRGPQGTLRGRASPSGSIAVTTRRPDLDEVGAVFNGTITDLHARKVDGAFNIPIISEVLAVRVAGVIDNNRANRVRSLSEAANPQFSEGPFSRTKSIRASARFEPTDWIAVNAMYQDLHAVRHTYDQLISESLFNPGGTLTNVITVNNANPALAPAVTPRPNTGPVIGAFDRLGFDEQGSYNRQDQKVFVGNVDVRFAGQRLSYVGSYNKNDFGVLAPSDSANFFAAPQLASIVARAPADLAGTSFAGPTIPAGAPGGFDPVCQNEARGQGANLSNATYNQCTHSFSKRNSHELRLASEDRVAGIFDYVIGVFYDKNEPSTNLTQETPVVASATATPINVLTVQRTAVLRRAENKEKSVFGNLTAHLLDDRLELSGGLRYIHYKSRDLPTFQSSSTGPFPCAELTELRCNALGNPAGTRVNEKNVIYTASVKYKLSDNVNLYALTGSSVRPGPNIIGVFASNITPLQNTFLELPPEKSKGYEVGAKTTFLDGRGRFNISAYYQDFKNFQFRGSNVFYVRQPSTVQPLQVDSFGYGAAVPVEVKGAEAEISLEVLDRLNVGLNLSYADGKIKNGTIACNDLNGDGIPDINPARPTLGQLQTAVGPGQTISSCVVNRRSSTAPKFSGNAQAEYGLELSPNTDAFVRGLYSFFGKTTNDPDNPFDDVGFYGLLNLYAGIRDKDGAWELTVFGKNITKEREVLSLGNGQLATSFQQGALGSSFTSPYRTVSVTAPREFGITAKIALGSR